MRIARIGLDVPRSRPFDYIAHDASQSDVGQRVVVSFGKRNVIGVVLDIADSSALPADRLKSITRVLRDTPGFSPEDMRLLHFASDYYHYPIGQVVIAALPQRLRRAEAKHVDDFEYTLTDLGSSQAGELPGRARIKRRLLDKLVCQNRLAAPELNALSRSERKALNEFVTERWVEKRKRTIPHPLNPAPAAASCTLTAAQSKAVESIRSALGRFQTILLCGVTGSGKTEIYLRAAADVIERGQQVLLLVPEIVLTPQLEAMVQARFPGTELARLHSGLNETERLRNWLAAQSGAARIVLGTRLAVFAPLPQLGMIVVDEEHDPSFRQTEGFCYSARDLAVVRARQRAVPIVLGSATPSIETYHNARSGRYAFLELPERINSLPPLISCIGVRGLDMRDGLSPQLLDAIERRLARNEQALIFINRRGYAPVLMCHGCGWLSGCHRCSAQLVLHLPARELRCHHCGHQTRVPTRCPSCGNADLSPVGQGTQRVEAALGQLFSGARILRVDRDSTSRKLAWSDMRKRIRAREVDILVGTQMLAKGHDFPHIALVGILNADSLLYSADFRASERLYATLTQVAGRAGRGDAQGEVLVQTEFPNHPLYTALRAQDFERFTTALIEERRLAGFPPFVHQALLRAEAANLLTALAFLERAREIGRALGGVTVYDPVPATMVRLAGRERAQLLVQSTSRSDLHAFLTAWRDVLAAEKSSAARWTLEIDPLEL